MTPLELRLELLRIVHHPQTNHKTTMDIVRFYEGELASMQAEEKPADGASPSGKSTAAKKSTA